MTGRTSRWTKTIHAPSVSQSGPRRQKPRYRRQLLLEPLEGRCLRTTITPTTFADVGSGSLRDAVLQFNADAGTDDDIILLDAGTYALTIPNSGGHHETAGLTGDLNLTQTSHRWIIQGAGSSTIIDASQLQDRVFQIVNPGTQVVFQDLVITGGLAQDNGSNGALAGTTDALGGGILNNGGNVTLDHVVLQNNVARGGDAAFHHPDGYNARGGGLYSSGGALTISGGTIANNQANGGRGGDMTNIRGGGLGHGGWAGGGGLYAAGGSLDISDSMIADNRGTGGRGGDGGEVRTTSGYPFFGGVGGPGQGGGLYVNGGSLMIATSTIASNEGRGGPGGLYGYDGASQGGGLYNGGTLTVSNSTVSNNNSVSGNIIYDSGGGGAIYNTSTLTVSYTTLSGNSAHNDGGGIYNFIGALTVSNSILSGNTAFGVGGGICNNAILTVSNSTLSANSTIYNAGGGIYTGGGLTRPVTLTNVTLTANRANFGAGLYVYYPNNPPVLHNTLIAGNFQGATGTTRDDVYGHLDPLGDYNLIGDGTRMTGLSNGVHGNLVGSAAAPIDPLLDSLQANGGPTLTHALLPGSPAIDAGNDAYATDFDQRGPGFPRISGPHIDIGAFEVQQGGGGGSGAGGGDTGGNGGPFVAAFLLGDVRPRLAGPESFPRSGTTSTATSSSAESRVAQSGAEREFLGGAIAPPAQLVDHLFAARADRTRAEELTDDLALA
jgi:hypothetical protein